jgi:hypothetical protein
MHFHFRTPCQLRARSTTVPVVILMMLTSGCASIRTTQTKDTSGTMKVHEVSITRTALIAGTPDKVFAFIAAEDVLPKVLTGYGPLPAVVRTSENTGPWNTPGSARLIHLADGSTVREQVTEYAAPNRFAYRVWEFGNSVIKALATQARGEWTFEAVPEGTKVIWTYTFTAKNGLAAVPLSGITQMLWRGYMDVCLENSQQQFSKP